MGNLPTLEEIALPLIGHSWMFPRNTSIFFKFIEDFGRKICEAGKDKVIKMI